MLPTIKNILYLTDLSKNSSDVFCYAVQIAKTFDAKMTVLHVLKRIDPAMEIPIRFSLGDDAYQKLVRERSEDILLGLKSRLQEFAEQELQDDPEGLQRISSILVHEGEPVADILETADSLNSDLLVMGDHSKGRLAHTFLGSTAEKVLRRARRPVLVVPIPPKEEEEESISL